MLQADYFIIPMVMGQVTNIINALKTGYILVDCCILGALYLIYTHFKPRDMIRYISSFVRNTRNKQTITLTALEHKRSTKFRAIMFYLSNSNDTIYKVREIYDLYWDDNESDKIEKISEYFVDQTKEFKISEDIYGTITSNSKEKSRGLVGMEYVEFTTLKVYSYKLSLLQLQDWITVIVKNYKHHLKTTSNETQLYITVSPRRKLDSGSGSGGGGGGGGGRHNSKSCELSIESAPWESMITFENSYFNDMKAIIKKIDFFLNNKDWYLARGIPYNLGILLYGEPGCGKTRFIKQLMNYTGRHGIDIKLNDSMNFNDLYNIIFKEEISDDYIITQDQRILIFEDIDSMGEAVKCRDMKEREIIQKKEQLIAAATAATAATATAAATAATAADATFLKMTGQNASLSAASIIPNAASLIPSSTSNNLSYLLNMFDGINECCGRIIIMTSNKPEVLDKALIRPGRIDIKIKFQRCTRYDVMRLINLFWDMELTEDMILPELEMKYTSADIYNIFRTTDDFDEIKGQFCNSACSPCTSACAEARV
jgi:hypothetical protein